jgi:uncharacterized protein YjbJ (UPF0337 family)
MNWDQVEGKWKQLTGSARERWGKLTDDDIQTLTGQKDQLVGKIQERYGIAKAEAEKQADAWSQALKETRRQSAPPLRAQTAGGGSDERVWDGVAGKWKSDVPK